MPTKNARKPTADLVMPVMRELMKELSHIHVIPSRGRWSVVRDGASRASRVLASKDEALKYARRRARRDSLQVVVHDRNGWVESRETL